AGGRDGRAGRPRPHDPRSRGNRGRGRRQHGERPSRPPRIPGPTASDGRSGTETGDGICRGKVRGEGEGVLLSDDGRLIQTYVPRAFSAAAADKSSSPPSRAPAGSFPAGR